MSEGREKEKKRKKNIWHTTAKNFSNLKKTNLHRKKHDKLKVIKKLKEINVQDNIFKFSNANQRYDLESTKKKIIHYVQGNLKMINS